LKTALIKGKDIPDFDSHIMNNLLVRKSDLDIVMEEEILIGVRNVYQDIYRIIGVSSLKQFNNASEELEELGLSNELEEIDRVKDGRSYNAIFSL
jgi:hypothetical protein